VTPQRLYPKIVWSVRSEDLIHGVGTNSLDFFLRKVAVAEKGSVREVRGEIPGGDSVNARTLGPRDAGRPAQCVLGVLRAVHPDNDARAGVS
jgi:hypothetical protein